MYFRFRNKIKKTFIHHQINLSFFAEGYNLLKKFRIHQNTGRVVWVTQKNHLQIFFLQSVQNPFLQSKSIFFFQDLSVHLTSHSFQCLGIFCKGRCQYQRSFRLYRLHQCKDQFCRPVSTDQPFHRNLFIFRQRLLQLFLTGIRIMADPFHAVFCRPDDPGRCSKRIDIR